MVTSDSDEEMNTIEGGPRPSSPRDGDTWTAPEPSAAAGPSRTFWSTASWAGLNVEDARGGPSGVVDVDISDITRARQALDELEESRRSFAATVRAEKLRFFESRDLLATQRQSIMEARDHLAHARAELERRGAELEERERGLTQREAAIDASRTTAELHEQL